MFRRLAQRSQIQIQVAYCNIHVGNAQFDEGFGIDVKWDTPLFEGYPWINVKNRSKSSKSDAFFSLFNPGIWRLASRDKSDVVVLYTGYICATFWIALMAAKWNGIPVLFGTDAHELTARDRKLWKLWIKKLFWPYLFRLADVVLAPSSGTVSLIRSLGIAHNRIVLTPYCVDNDWWIQRSRETDRKAVRDRWNIPEDAVVVLFCAKLQSWKRPEHLLRAFAKITDANTYLIFAGEGPSRPALESEARALGIGARVRFLGFVNQSGLPETYSASDLFVLPSEYEPFGVVVNEAMLCGCSVIVSDRVGARFDLVLEGETGFVFPFGDIEKLSSTLSRAINDPEHLKEMGEASRRRMLRWSPANNISGFEHAIALATGVSSTAEDTETR
jgi:glycosyltransferase involved in cell wall biosynthesis